MASRRRVCNFGFQDFGFEMSYCPISQFPLPDSPILTLAHVLFSRRGIWADFGFALCVFQISKLRGHSAGDCRGLATTLETREGGAIAPGKRSAQPLLSCQSCIMHDVDQPLVIGLALFVA